LYYFLLRKGTDKYTLSTQSISVCVEGVCYCGRKLMAHGRGRIALVSTVSLCRMSITVTRRTDAKRSARVTLTLVIVTEIRG
jgi:hypothetical protein